MPLDQKIALEEILNIFDECVEEDWPKVKLYDFLVDLFSKTQQTTLRPDGSTWCMVEAEFEHLPRDPEGNIMTLQRYDVWIRLSFAQRDKLTDHDIDAYQSLYDAWSIYRLDNYLR